MYYHWRESSVIQKVLFVAGLISIAASSLLIIADEADVLETTVICRALQAIWYFGVGCIHKNQWMRLPWFILAGLYSLLFLWGVF